MELATFFSIFGLVFIGEFGDKTQFAAGTGALANRSRTWVIYLGSIFALVIASGLTTFAAGLIPTSWLIWVSLIGGCLLIGYGIYLFKQAEAEADDDDEVVERASWALFLSQFWIVLLAEISDKSQIMTAGAAVKNNQELWTVFAASASALILVTSLTVWGITKVPERWTTHIQKLGAFGMVLYGLYMILSPN